MVFLSLRFLSLWAFCSVSVVYSHVTPGRRDNGFGKPSQLYNRNLPTPTVGASRAAETFYVRDAPVDPSTIIPFGSIPVVGGTVGQISPPTVTPSTGVASDDAPSDDDPEDQDQDQDQDENTSIVDSTILSRRQTDPSQLTGILPVAAPPILPGTGNPIGLVESSAVGNTLLPVVQNAGAPSPPAPPIPARRHLKKARFTKRQSDDFDYPSDIDAEGYDDAADVHLDIPRSTPEAKAKRHDSNAAQDANQGISNGKATVDDVAGTNTSRIAGVTRPGSVSRGTSYARRQDSDAPEDVTQDANTTVIDALSSSASRVIPVRR